MAEETLFEAALTVPEAERGAFLDRECVADHDLRARVDALLAAHDVPGGILDRPAVEERPPAPSDLTTFMQPNMKPDVVIGGRYTLLEKIGEGGMGDVWVAKQTEPVKRRVALKLIKTGMDSKAVLARFEQERQALAMMDHPNIAKVLDGGMTPTGQPFFVMELVNGLPLIKYCDEAKLTPKARLELFVHVCQAVQHAHQKGIIHRDLKPANILVGEVDGNPVPKVIDFGVAKATAGKLTDESMFTQFGAVVGTLEYMAPEQAGVANEDIDTRADIYSLGVILYELLTGLKPIDAKRLKSTALLEMIRVIKEEEPDKPSTRLATDASLPVMAASRQTEPKTLTAMLRGDLDCVVMKCLEKNRSRRYDTVNGFAADIRRHLAHETVMARPPSTAYRMQKAWQRNKLAYSAGLAIAAALMIGIVASVWQAVRATRAEKQAVADAARATAAEKLAGQRLAESEEARAEAEAISKFMSGVFLSPTGPYAEAGAKFSRKMTVLEALAHAVKRLETDTSLPPARRARVKESMAATYFYMGLPEESIPLRESVFAYYSATLGADDPKTLGIQFDLTHSYRVSKHTDKAIEVGEDCLARLRRVRGPESKGTLWFSVILAEAYEDAGRAPDALALREDIVPRMYRVLGPTNYYTNFAKNGLASSYTFIGRHEDAIKLREEVVASQKGTVHPHELWARGDLALCYWSAGRRDEAIALCEKTAETMRRVLDPDHPWTKTMEDRVAEWKAERDGNPTSSNSPSAATLCREGKFAEAAQVTRDRLAKHGDALGKNESIERMVLAATLLAAGDRDAYKAACADGVRRFAGGTNEQDAERMAKICLLGTDSGVAAASVAALVATAQTVAQPWRQLLNALAEYRLGHWDTATDWAGQARACVNPPDASVTATAAAILALVEHQRQHPAESKAALEAAKTAIAANWPAGTHGDWHNWLIADLIAKEAESLLKPAK